jgi:hypothetical protein
MKRFCMLVCVFLLTATVAFAAKPKSYQVTGPVLEVTPDMITVQKGDDKWEIARDGAAAVKGGDLKVGSKVTIEYTMQAKSIEVKPAKTK